MISIIIKGYLKPFYYKSVIGKDEYKLIMRKAVEKVYHSRSENIIPEKVKTLVHAYVDRYKQ